MLGSAPVVNGVATLSVAGLPLTTATGTMAPIIPGQYTVTATYLAQNSALAVQILGTHTILLGPVTVTLTPAPPTVTLGPSYFYGQGVNGYVNFGVVDSTYPPHGSWTQLSNGVGVPGCIDLPFYAGNPPMPVSSSCPYGYPTLLDTGNYSFVEAYNGGPANGDVYNGSGESSSYSFAVTPDTTTVNSLTTSGSPAIFGTPVTFTATLTGNVATPTGTVRFFADGNLLGTGQLNASGQASVTTSALTVGTHTITANYPATLDFLGAVSGTLQQVIAEAPLTSVVALSSNINPSVFGETVTFTATVSVPGPFVDVVQSGTITFLDGTTAIGTGAIDRLGQAKFAISTLAIGSHPIAASYPGVAATGGPPGSGAASQGISPAISPVVTQEVAKGIPNITPGFSLTVTPTPVTVPAGQDAILLVTVQEFGTFLQPVKLSCTGLPTEAACNFVTSTIPVAGGSTTLDLSTHAPHACGNGYEPYVKSGGGSQARVQTPTCGSSHGGGTVSARATRGFEVGGPTLAGLLLLLPRRKWLRRRGLLMMVAMLAGIVGLSGCGGACTDLGTLPGTYTVTVVATASGGTVESQKVAMTVLVP
jgi:hypothetical protein